MSDGDFDFGTRRDFWETRWRTVTEITRNGRVYRVSTVELPIDHGFGGPPLWFETMVFDDHINGPSKLGEGMWQWRYGTREEAERGHAEVVETWQPEENAR